MKNIFLSILLCALSHISISQKNGTNWQQVPGVPSADIYTVKTIDDRLYASTIDRVYQSDTTGKEWRNSSKLNPSPSGIDDIFEFQGKLFAAAMAQGVFVSEDQGNSWRVFNNGLSSRSPAEFAERNEELYLATNEQGIYKLSGTGTHWQEFNTGLASGTTFSFENLASAKYGLIGGVGANGVVAVRNDKSATWETSYLRGRLAPGLMTFDVIQAKKFIWAFTNDQAYASSDGGKFWVHVGAGMRRGHASKALQVGDTLYATVNYADNNFVIYKRGLSEPLSSPWTTVGVLPGYFSYGFTYLKNKLYFATHRGLFSIDLPANEEIPAPGDDLEKITVYPNPAIDHIVLSNGKAAGWKYFQLFNAKGWPVFLAAVRSDLQNMDITRLLPGEYYYLLTSGKGNTKRGKILVQR